jgi:hypothetical protein
MQTGFREIDHEVGFTTSYSDGVGWCLYLLLNLLNAKYGVPELIPICTYEVSTFTTMTFGAQGFILRQSHSLATTSNQISNWWAAIGP